jgi:hypothetical protein
VKRFVTSAPLVLKTTPELLPTFAVITAKETGSPLTFTVPWSAPLIVGVTVRFAGIASEVPPLVEEEPEEPGVLDPLASPAVIRVWTLAGIAGTVPAAHDV